jgi:hypothetical protein
LGKKKNLNLDVINTLAASNTKPPFSCFSMA